MRAMSPAPVTVAERRTSRTRLMIGVTLVLLLAEFLLGMYVNLFVPTPHGQPVVLAHILLGTLLLVAALVTTLVAAAGFVLAAACYVVVRDLGLRGAA